MLLPVWKACQAEMSLCASAQIFPSALCWAVLHSVCSFSHLSFYPVIRGSLASGCDAESGVWSESLLCWFSASLSYKIASYSEFSSTCFFLCGMDECQKESMADGNNFSLSSKVCQSWSLLAFVVQNLVQFLWKLGDHTPFWGCYTDTCKERKRTETSMWW